MGESREFVPWPAAPGNGATIVMFATHTRFAGGSGAIYKPLTSVAGRRQLEAVTLTWLRNDQASAANGLRVYGLDDTDTWREVDLKTDAGAASIGSAAPVQVAALIAGQEQRETLIVKHLKGVAVEYTAGATGPTAWNGCIALDWGAAVVAI